MGAGICFVVCIANEVGDKGGDDFGEADDGETDEGVGDGLFGLFDLARVASRGHIGDTANENKYNSDDAGEAEEPLDSVGNHLANVGISDAILTSGKIAAKIAIIDGEDYTNSAHDGASEHGNGETDEGMGESFFAGGNFTGIATREHVQVATIYSITEDKVGSSDANIGGNIGGNLPDAGTDGGLAIHGFDITIPGDKAGEVAICTAVALIALD